MLPALDSITVTWIDLDLPLPVVENLYSLLNDDERQKVCRFASPRQRRRAVVRSARRRQALAAIYGMAPQEIELTAGPNGMPIVFPGRETLHLSTSSSKDVGLIAIARGRRVGVDVEALAEIPATSQFVEWVATTSEARLIRALSYSDQSLACLRLWTRKEAILKATGEGLGQSMKSVEVPLGAEPWGQSFASSPGAPQWLLYELNCPGRYLNAALVTSVEAKDKRIPSVTVSDIHDAGAVQTHSVT
jgi:4'-phosphopantetheinyl transferase